MDTLSSALGSRFRRLATLLTVAVIGCSAADRSRAVSRHDLTGAWRAKVQFASGAFAGMKDLEFLYVFNAGGTMTESSNYDAAPPVAPAYGVWREVGPGQYEAKYLFFVTKPPTRLEEITGGGGWPPTGYGVFTERIRVAEDGRSYSSTIVYEAFDPGGEPVAGGGTATGQAERVGFRAASSR